MSVSGQETWTLLHGLVLGALFLLAFAGAIAGIYSLRPQLVSAAGVVERVRRLRWGTTVMAVLVWLTVITGTFIVYPWYRARPPAGADLSQYPRSFLLADPNLSSWHTFGMEWKEHVAWFAPIFLTAVAYIVWRYGSELVHRRPMRNVLIAVLTFAFVAAGIAGVLGALITKAAPVG
jgi:phosphoglycerol transferase MdoB-like AlkP superfamily enzyme